MLKQNQSGDGRLLRAIKLSSNELRGNHLDQSKMESTYQLPEFDTISKYLGTDPKETAIFVATYVCCYNQSNEVGMSDIAEFFECDMFDLLPYYIQMESLINKGFILEKEDSESEERGMAFIGSRFRISGNLTFNIIFDDPINIKKIQNEVDRYFFVDEVWNYSTFIMFGRNSTEEFCEYVKRYEEQHPIEFVKKTTELISDNETRIMFYCLCNDYVNSTEPGLRLNDLLRRVYSNCSVKMSVRRALSEGRHQLIDQQFVEITTDDAFADSTITLTEKGAKFFLQEDANMYLSEEENTDRRLVAPENIKSKELFFDENTEKMYKMLINSLKEENYKKLTKRLAEKGVSKGVSIMLYGQPGTGKTEMVYQIAKATGRQIFPIQISQIKDKYFGESEKRIKGVFVSYKKMCENSTVKPILLFNEADGIFSKRKDVLTGNCAQAENSIQNIILEEMEKLDGILIATTNLIENFDRAFERRFLYKVQFNRPTEEAKMKIWQSKMPNLTNDETLTLAKRFDLSGGEIDNIVKKTIMNEIVDNYDQTPIEKIIEFCENEKISKTKHARIGFCA